MWFKAVERQYNLFGILFIFFITTLSILGTIISQNPLANSHKILFSLSSIITFIAVIALLRMTHIERSIAFKVEPPKGVDDKLQNEENRLRHIVNFSIPIAIGLILLLINLLVWKVDLQVILLPL